MIIIHLILAIFQGGKEVYIGFYIGFWGDCCEQTGNFGHISNPKLQ